MNSKIETIENSLKAIAELEKLVTGDTVGDADSIGNKLYSTDWKIHIRNFNSFD